MSEELDALWALHGLDEELVQIGAALARLPAERAALAKRAAAEHLQLDELKTRVAAVQKRRRELEREITALTETERRFQSQLPAIKKNEEYQALLHEIDGTKRRRSDLETEVLIGLEQEEQAQGERPALERALKEVEDEVAVRLEQIAEDERRARERVTALEAGRQRHMALLPQATRTRYERIRGSREGRAVVPILKGACGGCFRAQPPQVLQEAKHRDRLLVCDGCGRLVIWPPEEASSAGPA